MKRSILLLCTVMFSMLWVESTGQTYGYEMEMTDFRQTSEAEFRFDVFLRTTASSDPIAIENFQFQLNFNNAILNGGSFVNSFLTVDASETELVGNLAVITDDLFVTDGTNILFASGDAGVPGSTVTVLDNTWKKVATFIVQLSSGGALHNFGDANPELEFRPDPGQLYTLLNRCEYTGTSPNFTKDGTDFEQVTDRTLIPTDGTALDTRQLAGYCFTESSDWLTLESWNNTLPTGHPAYHQAPGSNSNALINGNVTILSGQDISLTALGGNGGEVTVLTGAETLYTLSGSGNFLGGGVINFWSDGVGSTNIGNPVDLPAGTTITLQAVDFAFPPNVTWTTNPPGSGTFGDPNSSVTLYTTIADNVEVIATFSLSKNSISSGTNEVISGALGTEELFASLTIAPGGTLTVDKLFNDSDNGVDAIVIQSVEGQPNGSLIQANAGTEASIEQFYLKEVWHLVGQPVAFTVIDLFDFPPGGPFVWLYPHLESSNTWGEEIWILGTPMELGKGYLSWMGNVPDPATGEKVTFTGALNAGDYTTGVNGFYALEYTTGAAEPGYNFISNPYPSALQGDIDSWTKTNVDNSIWIWEGAGPGAGGQYRYWNGVDGSNGLGLGTIDGGVIPPMQGFFVKANATGPSLTLPQAGRIHGNKEFYKNDPILENTLRIDAQGNGGDDAVFIRFMDDATNEYDSQLDVYKMFGNDNLPQLYTNIADAQLSINTLSDLEFAGPVAMGFECNAPGIYTLTASGMDGFEEGMEIYLEDVVDGAVQCLNENPVYSFVNGPDSPADRFLIHFGLTTVNNNIHSNPAHIYAYGNVIYVDTEMKNDAFVNVQNVMGQSVYSGRINGSGTHTITMDANGIYLVNLIDPSGVLINSTKLIIQ